MESPLLSLDIRKEKAMDSSLPPLYQQLFKKQLKRSIYLELYMRKLITDEQLDYLLNHNL